MESMDRSIIGSVGGFQITLGFVLNVIITITTIVVSFATIRNDTFKALEELTKQERVIQEQQVSIIDLKMTVQKIAIDQDYFHKQYNEDMNRYIRERPKN